MPDTRTAETLAIIPADLAPGDARCADFDFSPFTLQVIRSSSHPLFDVAYQKLWEEFGDHGGMEQRDVICARLKWNPAEPIGDYRLLYRMLAVMRGERMAAVRDTTAILHGSASGEIVTHLSHVLIEADYRGGGLAGWMRAFPLQIARRCAQAAGLAGEPEITLVAEMERPDPRDPMSNRRLVSYERAGFLKVDPSVVRYYQPDFRDPGDIDSAGGPKPIPFQLVIRRVGRETETEISGAEVRRLVGALYGMYAMTFRPSDMSAAYATLERYPDDSARIALVPPTQ